MTALALLEMFHLLQNERCTFSTLWSLLIFLEYEYVFSFFSFSLTKRLLLDPRLCLLEIRFVNGFQDFLRGSEWNFHLRVILIHFNGGIGGRTEVDGSRLRVGFEIDIYRFQILAFLLACMT